MLAALMLAAGDAGMFTGEVAHMITFIMVLVVLIVLLIPLVRR